MINEKKNEIRLTNLSEARLFAKSGMVCEKFKPLRLRSLKEARAQIKSSTKRPESVLSLPDLFMMSPVPDDETSSRTVYSLSPKAEIEFSDSDFTNDIEKVKPAQENEAQAEISPRIIETIPECEHESAKEIDPSLNEEEPRYMEVVVRDFEENNREIGEPEGKKEEGGLSQGITEGKSKPKVGSRKEAPQKKKKNPAKPVKNFIKIKKHEGNVLKFIDEPKEKKKLTKSQQRVLLDRLQGFQIKPSK